MTLWRRVLASLVAAGASRNGVGLPVAARHLRWLFGAEWQDARLVLRRMVATGVAGFKPRGRNAGYWLTVLGRTVAGNAVRAGRRSSLFRAGEDTDLE